MEEEDEQRRLRKGQKRREKSEDHEMPSESRKECFSGKQ